MNDLIFEWRKTEAIQLPSNLALPQFKILGYTLNSCTKKYDTGKLTALFQNTVQVVEADCQVIFRKTLNKNI